MTLLTALTYGGREALEAFDHLREDEAEVLRERAVALLRIPRERRVPLIVRELKRLIAEGRAQLWSADPERIAHILRQERPALVEVALRTLPVATAAAVRKRLPSQRVRRRLVEPKPQILQVVRWKLQEALHREGQREGGGEFDLAELPLLTSRELATVCDRLGTRSLAPMLTSLPRAARESWLENLRPDLRRLASGQADAVANDALTADDAGRLLSRLGADPPSAIRRAGAKQVVFAALSHSRELARDLAQRHRKGLGHLLDHWLQDADAIDAGVAIESARQLVSELQQLAQDGIIDRLAIRERRERWRREK
jgi:hypothetical protein